ncbi:MAG: LysR family transcriptional regulator [Clostridia bacterium]|nr:LysR family transcriptional regulator [Clostridia bacterium]
MNILHMRYAVEVAKAGSINKAAEVLFVAQPNLSRAIKELEADLNITIFDRSAKGMVLTIEGREFVNYAQQILHQIEAVEHIYKQGKVKKQRFSVSVPRSGYISEAFSKFSKHIDSANAEIFYKETNSWRAINNILSSDYNLGIVRYDKQYDAYYKPMLEEKGLSIEEITEFSYTLVVNKNSPLANKETVKLSELSEYTEITHADSSVPSLPLGESKKAGLNSEGERRIFVFERASQFDLLSENDQTFMWVSPVPEHLLERFGLVQKKCDGSKTLYKDVLIYKKDYKLSKLDKLFIEEIHKTKPVQ